MLLVVNAPKAFQRKLVDGVDRSTTRQVKTNQLARHFRFLRQPSRPNAPRPEANSGRAAGKGTALTFAVKRSESDPVNCNYRGFPNHLAPHLN
jgi:hypothetical protein